jgi:hypothetical protein
MRTIIVVKYITSGFYSANIGMQFHRSNCKDTEYQNNLFCISAAETSRGWYNVSRILFPKRGNKQAHKYVMYVVCVSVSSLTF